MSSFPIGADWDEMRVQARRSQILEAAVKIFAEKGYHRATTKEIARSAGVAEGTIYLYFENKGELLISLMESFDQATTQAPDLSAGLNLPIRDLLKGRLKNDLELLGPNFLLMLAIMPEVLAEAELRAKYYQRIIAPTLDGIEAHLRMRLAQGEVDDLNVPMTSRIFVATLMGLEMMHILGDDMVQSAWEQPEQMAEDIARVILDGIQPTGR